MTENFVKTKQLKHRKLYKRPHENSNNRNFQEPQTKHYSKKKEKKFFNYSNDSNRILQLTNRYEN